MHLLLWVLVACTAGHVAPQEALAGRVSEPFASAPAGAISAAALETVRTYAAERSTRGLLVLVHGQLAYEWYAAGTDATTLLDGRSMTKTITALAFGILQGEQRIPPVDRPITETVFPELARDATRSLITWRDLLEMASGLGNDADQTPLEAPLERTALSIPGLHTPGFAFDDNDANTELLGLAVERASGQRLATVLSDRLWRPLGNGEASIALDGRGRTAYAYCCLLATTRDWARVGQLLLDGGRVGTTQVVPRDFVIRMTLPSRNNPDYGWHLWRADDGPGSERAKGRSEPLLEKAMFWLDGGGAQRIYVLPASGLVVVRMGDEPPDWDDAFVVNTLIRGTRP